jgi:hypothetical protein
MGNAIQYWHLIFKKQKNMSSKIKILRMGWPPITMFTPNFMKTDAEIERGNTQTFVNTTTFSSRQKAVIFTFMKLHQTS